MLDQEKSNKVKDDLKKRTNWGMFAYTATNKVSEDEPAGYRNPKPFKKTYEDKIPDWIARYRGEGMKDEEIAQILFEKERKYVNKWGNRSKVGGLLNSALDDPEIVETVKIGKGGRSLSMK